jgi:fucose permease
LAYWILFYAIRDECCLKKSVETNVTVENDKFVSEDDNNQQSIEVIVSDNPTNLSSSSKIRPLRIILIVSSLALFLLLHDGTESGFGAYLHSYASLHLNFLKDIAAYLNSAFWASFAFGRLVGIPLSTKFSSFQMIFIDLIGCISSLVLLWVFNKSSIILWIGSILFGLFIASIYPSTISYTEEHITLTGKRMPILAAGGSAGGAVIPLLIGFTMNSTLIGTIGFVFVTLAVMILASILFGIIAFCSGRRS